MDWREERIKTMLRANSASATKTTIFIDGEFKTGWIVRGCNTEIVIAHDKFLELFNETDMNLFD